MIPLRTCSGYSAVTFTDKTLEGLDGDVRVRGDTIIGTYYHVDDPQWWRKLFEGQPGILDSEGVDPAIPWLYGLKLDFRFK